MSRRRCIGLLLAALPLISIPTVLPAQVQPPVDSLSLSAASATTWSEGRSNVIQLRGPVVIEMDQTRLSANSAVIWLTPYRSGVIEQQQAEIALVGDAAVEQDGVVRTGPQVYVSALVRGNIKILAADRFDRDQSSTDLYRAASAMRPSAAPAEGTVYGAATQPSAAPFTGPRILSPVAFQFQHIETRKTDEGKIAAVLSGGVLLIYRSEQGESIELQADKAVVFTTLRDLGEVGEADKIKRIQDAADAVYLEGDARVTLIPKQGGASAEQRLLARRVYYELATDRAILTDVVLHTTEPQTQLNVAVRADSIRMLSREEYKADGVRLSTSRFATPSFAVAADKAYIRREDTGDPRVGSLNTFRASGATGQAWGIPFFYFPVVGGSITDRGFPLRTIQFGSQERYGFNTRTEWGFFETIGQPAPRGLDLTYRLDYYAKRGPAIGANADYEGGHVTDTTREPWNFTGDVRSFLVYDDGKDFFGGDRNFLRPNGVAVDNEGPPREYLRGRFLWEHQQFLPDDWQLQLRGAWVSDPTFLEQWNQRDFYQNRQHDTSTYLKHQTNTEALTFLATIQPNNFVTTSDLVQEQFEVERYPEIGYHRIGDSIINDNFTLFSDNSLSALRFNRSGASLQEQGYATRGNGTLDPGLPSLGLTGAASPPDVPESTNYRGDFRQEIDYPFTAAEFKVVPYVMGRYTGYTDSPTDSNKNRVMAGTGVRTTTAFWAVDDTAHSDFFDINRMRHVVEPEVNLFTSAQTVDRGELFIYDEDVDKVNDVSAAEIGLRQRWQTKRGGPGRWRSVDFLTLNVTGNFFANKPPDEELNPLNRNFDLSGWRGLYFYSAPEASVPRNSINADGTWRFTDQFAVLSDAQWNADESSLATASVGVAIKQEPRITYFAGTRYIEPLNSNIATFAVTYDLSKKYTLAMSQSYDFSADNNVHSSFYVVRRFDTFAAAVSAAYDANTDESSFGFSVYPIGLADGGAGFSTDQLGGAFSNQRR